MPPLAGQALNAGVRDAANIAWKLAAVIRDGAPDVLIDTYEQERRPHAADMVRLSHLIGKVVMATNHPLVLARDLAINASGLIPPLKHWITQLRFLKQPHYTKGCIVAPTREIGAQMVGSALPQPSLNTEDHGEVPLDQLLGSDWSLVHISVNQEVEIVRLPGGNKAIRGRETASQFSHLTAGTTLIVRPERYVAAVTTRAEEHAALTELARLVPDLGGGKAPCSSRLN